MALRVTVYSTPCIHICKNVGREEQGENRSGEVRTGQGVWSALPPLGSAPRSPAAGPRCVGGRYPARCLHRRGEERRGGRFNIGYEGELRGGEVGTKELGRK